jgi:hypothetical protein
MPARQRVVLIAKGALTVAGGAAYQSVSERRQGKCNLRYLRQGVSCPLRARYHQAEECRVRENVSHKTKNYSGGRGSDGD